MKEITAAATVGIKIGQRPVQYSWVPDIEMGI
jgi:hypothetical protein